MKKLSLFLLIQFCLFIWLYICGICYGSSLNCAISILYKCTFCSLHCRIQGCVDENNLNIFFKVNLYVDIIKINYILHNSMNKERDEFIQDFHLCSLNQYSVRLLYTIALHPNNNLFIFKEEFFLLHVLFLHFHLLLLSFLIFPLILDCALLCSIVYSFHTECLPFQRKWVQREAWPPPQRPSLLIYQGTICFCGGGCTSKLMS